jgi:hypothetical protein
METANVTEAPPYCAVMMAVCDWETEAAAAENCPDTEPPESETPAGTVTDGELLDRLTVMLPAGGPGRSTVQVVAPPDGIAAGVQVSEVKVTVPAVKLMLAVCELPFRVAVIVAAPLAGLLAAAVAENVPVVECDAMIVLGGTVMVGELLVRLTTAPPVPAAGDKVIVHLAAAPGVRLEGAQLKLVSLGAAEPPKVTSNSTGCNPFTSAITEITDPAVPAPAVSVVEVCPWLSVDTVSAESSPFP